MIECQIPSETFHGECGEFDPPNHVKPNQQVDMGVPSDQVRCKTGLELIFKNSDQSPKCVTLTTKKVLLDREWAILTIAK